MYYTDYHCHSILSMDGQVPLETLAEHMVRAGIHEMCLTDHFDLFDANARRCTASDWDWNAAIRQYDHALSLFEGKLTIRLGLEFGMGHVDPAVSRAVLDQPRLDFVIGSVHNLSPRRGGGDLWYEDMSTPEACTRLLEDYFSSMEELVVTDFYDTLGHIPYPLRYMNGHAAIHPWLDRVSGILEAVISRGKALEVNTYRGRSIGEWIPILERYRDLGGTLLTVGSDAHEPRFAGAGVREAYDLLRGMGFRHVCTYEKRVPHLIEL